MTKAEEILAKYPSVKLGLDEHYGKQTVLNALNEALRIHDFMPSCEGNCGMNYCDDNGCIERKRILVEPKDLPEHCH
jgi:hypothetical protein